MTTTTTTSNRNKITITITNLKLLHGVHKVCLNKMSFIAILFLYLSKLILVLTNYDNKLQFKIIT